MNTTFFKSGITNIIPDHNTTIGQILADIKSPKWAGVVNQTRVLPYGSKEYKEAKSKLPYFTPHGTITEKRNDSNMVSLSGVFCLDIDRQDNMWLQIVELKEQLRNDEFTYAYFDSPSEQGLKVFIKCQLIRLCNAHRLYN